MKKSKLATSTQPTLTLTQNKKLLVIYRLEPDCLGSVGYKKINQFCAHLTKNSLPVESGFIMWTVLPRIEITEKEFEFHLGGKLLKKHQVEKYLALFESDVASLEESLSATILKQMNHYFT